MKPPALAKNDDSCLIAYLDTLPYQEGTPLSPIYEEDGSTEVIMSSSEQRVVGQDPWEDVATVGPTQSLNAST